MWADEADLCAFSPVGGASDQVSWWTSEAMPSSRARPGVVSERMLWKIKYMASHIDRPIFLQLFAKV
jgi:hypothetical protein